MQEESEKKPSFVLGEGFSKQRPISVVQNLECDAKDIFSLRFDQDDQYLAVGLGNGDVKIFNLESETEPHVIKGTTIEEETPTTVLRWRPPFNRTKHILVSGNSDGSIIHWHAPSGKRLHKILEENNSVLCMDFNYDGSMFATGGRDFKVKIYDEDIKSLYHEYGAADWTQRGHSNRVFAVKFLQDQPNVLISGGWDSNILIWDVREKVSVGQFYGPSISGDSLDYCISKGLILSGSYRTEKQLQLWDFRTRKLLKEISWSGGEHEINKQIYVYTAQFSKLNDDFVIAGCSGVNEVRIFDVKREHQPCASITKLEKGIYSVDFANTTQRFAFGGGEGVVRVVKL